MTWQVTLYFASFLLTCLLLGFLSIYAWRQPPLPGVRVYAWLALSQCLMALTDVITMLSTTQAQALFWFKISFLFASIIPVLWSAFALIYSGHREWLSKKLIIVAIIIAGITQAMLWSNDLHGLWVKQEVGFHQIGFLWMVETSTRIPGLWFMVNLFYGLILLLVGIVVILLTAWHKRRDYRSQALLLSAGALVALITALISLFNLLPRVEFDLFTPGIGISALFVALAIFRFQFLKRSPMREGKQPGAGLEQQEKRALAVYIFIFFLLVSGLTAIGYESFLQYDNQYREQVENQLSTISALKVDELVDWHDERMGDANMFFSNPAFRDLVGRYLENPDEGNAKGLLQAWLNTAKDSYQYDRISLLDSNAIERMSTDVAPAPVTAYIAEQAAESLALGRVTFLDFYSDSVGGKLHLSFLVPLFDGTGLDHPLGVLVMRIDPNIYLFPYISKWPAYSETAETLLVRRDGDDVLFLNELLFQPNTALNLRIPLENTQVLAVKAVLGQEGFAQGIDYRGVPVIGYLRALPGLPWFLVARMDAAEINSPLRERLWLTVIFFGILILAAATGFVLVWRHQRVRYYRGQALAAEALRDSEEKLKTVLDVLPVGVSVLDADRQVVFANPALLKILGLTAEGLEKEDYKKRKYIRTDGTAMPAADFASMRAVREQKMISNVETGVVKKNGNIVWTEVSAILAPYSDWKVVIVTIDITERKRTQQKLKVYSEHLEAMVDDRTRELRESQEKLIRQERLASLGQLAGSVGHELRNPLGVISNAIYLLKTTSKDASKTTREYLDMIENETHNADKIVADLLDFARIQSVDREPADVPELVQHVLNRFPAPESVNVALKFPTDLPKVYIDPRQVEQVLGNLVVNACQAMPDGGKLTITAHQKKDQVAVVVKDAGAGITPENMQKIFEPLFTTKAKGIGLGLAVSRKLVEANGGRIDVQSEPGKGSAFTVYLPVSKEME